MSNQFRMLFVCMMLGSLGIFAQKQTQYLQQTWLGYMNQTRISDRWGLWGDFHLRTRDHFFDRLSTSIVRLGLTYYVNDKVKLTAGYAYVNAFPSGAVTVTQPEHRPWQQIQWHSNYPKLRLMQWVRLEERFRKKLADNDHLGDGYDFNYRVRYNFLLTVPLGRKPFAKNSLSFIVNDELHVNMGEKIVYNYFDQNRFFAGFSLHLNATDNIQFGYMNLFQQLPAGNRYRSIHAPRIFYFQNLDLRRKK
jgi:Protein of unknown function (DUF2490)